MNTAIINKSRNAVAVWFDQSKMFVRLDDGREIAIQIDWFPRLREASEKEN